MCRLRQGRANPLGAPPISCARRWAECATLELRELTIGPSGFYTHDIVAACRDKSVRFSITVRQHQSVRNIIEAIPEAEWTPIPYWMEGAADVAETAYTPFGSEPDAVPVRLIVRRVKPTPGSQLALFATYSYHAFITDREGDTLDLEADHRRHAEIENAIRDLKRCGAQPPPLGTVAGRPDHRPGALDQGLGEALVTTKNLRRRYGSPARPGAYPGGWPWQNQFSSADYAPCHYPPDRPTASDPSARPNCLADLRQAGSRVSPAAICPLISPGAGAAVRQHWRGYHTLCPAIGTGQGRAASIRLLSSFPPSRRPDGGFGLRHPQGMCLDKGYDFAEVRRTLDDFGSPIRSQRQAQAVKKEATPLGGGTHPQLAEPLPAHFGPLGQVPGKLHRLPSFRLCPHRPQSRRIIRIASKRVSKKVEIGVEVSRRDKSVGRNLGV